MKMITITPQEQVRPITRESFISDLDNQVYKYRVKKNRIGKISGDKKVFNN
jgi:hypothetical protein